MGAKELPPVGVAPMPLTDVEIKKAKYTREDGKPERITDGGKRWRWKYRFGGKEKRLLADNCNVQQKQDITALDCPFLVQ